MNNPKIKVCGMTSLAQVAQLTAIGVDYAGFIFYEKSPRFVGNKINPADLKVLTGLKKVGVFVNETEENILNAVDRYGLDMVQLHGDEPPQFYDRLKSKADVIKVLRVQGNENLNDLLAPHHHAHYFLFDTKAGAYGGTGKKFDWSVLESQHFTRPYFLSGGIGAGDTEQVKAFTAANTVFALDINSKFETAPGVKDIQMIQEFVKMIR
ncbi:MAG: phosphoribosylanthranilate isomerase [Niabella sp.]